MMRRKDIIGDEIDDLSGLMSRAPALALLMLIFLLSLAGIPPTAGFIGKYFIFLSLIETGHYYLAVLGVVYAVVALYYYFRIVVVMFMKKPLDEVPYATSLGLRVALGVTLALTLANRNLSAAVNYPCARSGSAVFLLTGPAFVIK